MSNLVIFGDKRKTASPVFGARQSTLFDYRALFDYGMGRAEDYCWRPMGRESVKMLSLQNRENGTTKPHKHYKTPTTL